MIWIVRIVSGKMINDFQNQFRSIPLRGSRQSIFSGHLVFRCISQSRIPHYNFTIKTRAQNQAVMAERGGDRGGFGRGFGGRGDRGDRGRGKEEQWVPVTKLGRLIKEGRIRSLEQIYLHSLPVKEHQIIETLLGWVIFPSMIACFFLQGWKNRTVAELQKLWVIFSVAIFFHLTLLNFQMIWTIRIVSDEIGRLKFFLYDLEKPWNKLSHSDSDLVFHFQNLEENFHFQPSTCPPRRLNESTDTRLSHSLSLLPAPERRFIGTVTSRDVSGRVVFLVSEPELATRADDNGEEGGDAASLISSSEWSETMQNLITTLSPSPTSTRGDYAIRGWELDIPQNVLQRLPLFSDLDIPQNVLQRIVIGWENKSWLPKTRIDEVNIEDSWSWSGPVCLECEVFGLGVGQCVWSARCKSGCNCMLMTKMHLRLSFKNA
ncbi:hypothetical protein HHK36_000619 [Tetracentron sinense]|uniref:Uncharacterized protein n=1 Tax=Tetracentron sinense TaxID=13715 RepID=A0A835DQX0_TETSI|nr:hypothetical protein HHK36_000619 [Tetracentron sinense]